MLGSWLTWLGAFLVSSVPVLQALALMASFLVSLISIYLMLEKRMRERRRERRDGSRIIHP